MPPPGKNSSSPLSLVILILCALALAAYYRFPSLGERPMHTDEAILAVKLSDFQQSGHFDYDPKDFHGPGLHNLAHVWSKLSGLESPAAWTEARLRTVVVLCSLVLLLSTLWVRDALGNTGTAFAMLLMAVSPMMVYYSRYFIMEVPLVMFIMLSIAALWRWSQGGSSLWLIVAGISIGFQHATKETFVINLAAALIGYIAARLLIGDFSPRRSGLTLGQQRTRKANPWLWVSLIAVLTSITLYSGFFKDWQAVKDSVTTYLHYLQRAGGAGHEKPWHYYLTLIFWRRDGGLTWSEAMIGGLGIIGMLHAFLGNHQKNQPRQAFLVFLSTYTLVLFGIYSLLSYKTPWSILSAQHALTLLAGVGAAAISQAASGKVARLAWRICFLLGLYHLIYQTNLAIHRYAADSRNPYVYSHTSTNLLRLIPIVRDLRDTAPDGAFNVLVVNRDAGWPLPWYLRDIPSVRYATEVPETLDARVIIAETSMQSTIEAKFNGARYITRSPFGLRPGVLLTLWVEQALWERHHLRVEQEAAPK